MFVGERESEREKERDRSIEDKDSFDHTGVSLMSGTSLLEHLRYHHRCNQSERQTAEEKPHLLSVFKGGWQYFLAKF